MTRLLVLCASLLAVSYGMKLERSSNTEIEDISALLKEVNQIPQSVLKYWEEQSRDNVRAAGFAIAKENRPLSAPGDEDFPSIESVEEHPSSEEIEAESQELKVQRPQSVHLRMKDSYDPGTGSSCSCANAKDASPYNMASCLTYDRNYDDCVGGTSYGDWMCDNCGYTCCSLWATEANPDQGPEDDDFAESPSSQSGQKGKLRIVNGRDAALGEVKYQVAITNYQGSQYCGGTVIGERWVATAAHCFYKASKDSYEKAKNVYVRVGIVDLDGNTIEDSPAQQVLKTSLVLCHENYDSGDLTNDVCLLQLQRSIEFNEYVQPAKLATEKPAEGTPLIISGWGKLEDGGSAPKIMQISTFEVWNDDAVKKIFGGSAYTDGNVAGYYQEGGDILGTCQGDSGGPAVVTGDDGEAVLVGITSYGGTCAVDPSVFASVAYFNDWITATIAANPAS